MDLNYLVETVVYQSLIGGMTCLNRWDDFPMVRALVCAITHWTRPIVNHYITLSNCHNSPNSTILHGLSILRGYRACT